MFLDGKPPPLSARQDATHSPRTEQATKNIRRRDHSRRRISITTTTSTSFSADHADLASDDVQGLAGALGLDQHLVTAARDHGAVAVPAIPDERVESRHAARRAARETLLPHQLAGLT